MPEISGIELSLVMFADISDGYFPIYHIFVVDSIPWP